MLVASLFQVKYKANPLHMAAVICNCLREERRILSTSQHAGHRLLPRHETNSMQKTTDTPCNLLSNQAFRVLHSHDYYSIPVLGSKRLLQSDLVNMVQYYKCTYSTCYLVQCTIWFMLSVLDVYIYFIFRSSVFHVSISLMAGTTGEVNAKLSHLGEAESSWQQSGSHKKQRSGKLRPVLISVITAIGV